MPILDLDFNRAVLDITTRYLPHGFEVSISAPSTYAALKAHVARTGRLVVYGGASDQTIYGDPAVNHAFRAWHDVCHLLGNHDTSLAGEAATCRQQMHQLLQIYGDTPRTRHWQMIVEAEIIGQAQHFERHGRFPLDQAGFVMAYLRNPVTAVRQPY